MALGKKILWIGLLGLAGSLSWAQEGALGGESATFEGHPAVMEGDSASAEVDPAAVERDPAAALPKKERNYPGGSEEEDLRVSPTLPEAPIKTDARTVQRDVYRALYKEELKNDHDDAADE